MVEAGLGGRYDATNVIDSRVTALTNVGLEHTRWLGPTLRDIAEEKLAVLRPGTTLVLGADLAGSARGGRAGGAGAGARDRRSERRGAPPLRARGRSSGATSRSRASPPRRTWKRARGNRAIEPATSRPCASRASTAVPGRLQVVDEDPLTVLDGAHNPDAVAALVESLPEVLAGRRSRSCWGCSRTRTPRACWGRCWGCERAWFTAPPSSRALSPAALQSLARQLGFDEVACEPRPERALADARRWARERGGAVLATGSVYLVGDLLGRLDASGTRGGSQAPPRSATR